MERLLKIAELAELLGVEESTVYAWTSQKKIPFVKLGRLVKFRESDVRSWLDSKSVCLPAHTPPRAPQKPKKPLKSRRDSEIDRLVSTAIQEVLQ